MKKIEITVPNEVVATIVSLVMDYVTELHVTEANPGKLKPSASTFETSVAKRRNNSPVSLTRLGLKVLSWLPEDGTPMERRELLKLVLGEGYRLSSESAVLSGLKTEGCVGVTRTTAWKVIKTT